MSEELDRLIAEQPKPIADAIELLIDKAGTSDEREEAAKAL